MKRAWIGIVAAGMVGCGGSGGGGGPYAAEVARAVAYTVKQGNEPSELYLTDVEAGGARRVSGPSSAPFDLLVFAWSADHRYLAYHSDLDGDGDQELYVVTPGVDEEPGRLVSSGHVTRFVWSKTGADLAYVSTEDDPQEMAGYVLRDGAPAPLRITPPPSVVGGDVNDIAFAPNGARVAFTGTLESLLKWELFTVRLDGTGWVKVSGPMADGASAYAPAWSPTSQRIAWTGDPTQSGHRAVHSNLGMGGDLRHVSGASVAGGDVTMFQWSVDGERIAFKGDLLFDDVYELFTADPRGLARVRVSGPMATSGLLTVGDVHQFEWSPDGAHLAYTADQDVDEVADLYVTDGLTSNSWVQVSGAHPPTGYVMNWAWSPSGDRLLMRGDFEQNGRFEAYTVPPSGAPRVKVSGVIGVNGHVLSVGWSDDGARVLFRADVQGTNTFDLFSAPATGGPRINLSQLDAPGFVSSQVHPAAGGRVVFVGNLDVTSTDELWSVASDGTDLVKISGPLPVGADVVYAATR